MNCDMTSFFEHQRTSFKRNYLKNLILLAATDGHMDDNELKLLYKIGKRRGLKEWQVIGVLADNSPHEFFIPDSISSRMNLLYDFMEIVYADGHVNEREMYFINKTITAFNLPSKVSSELIIMFSKGTPSITEWSNFSNAILA